MVEVSGRAILGILKFIKAESGPDALKELLQGSPPEVLQVYARPILALKWYPYPAYIHLLRTIDRKWGKGDLTYCRILGENAASLDLKSFLKVYAATANQEELIKSCTMVWSSYFRNAGRMEAVAWAPQNTVLRIHDFPSMDPAHCRLMEGWMNEAIQLIGTKMTRPVTEDKCMSLGAAWHEFSCAWTIRSGK